MANPLFQQMRPNNMASTLNALKANPMQFLMQRKFNVPANIQNDPNAIIQHLMNTGQVSQAQYNRATEMVKNFR